MRLTSTGALDASFSALPVTGADPTVYALALQADGKIWAGGDFTYTVGTNTCASLMRLNSGGALDTSFATRYQAPWEIAQVRRFHSNLDGLLWAGGTFSQIDGRSYFGLARYANITDYAWLPLMIK